jgi:hypothetical protein
VITSKDSTSVSKVPMIRQDTALAAERFTDTFGGGGFVAEVYFI